jgi:hypothetical protein
LKKLSRLLGRLIGVIPDSWRRALFRGHFLCSYLGTWSESACAARIKAGDLPCYIKADYVTNASVTYRGFKGLTLSGYITNLDESQAPVDLKGGTGPRPRSFRWRLTTLSNLQGLKGPPAETQKPASDMEAGFFCTRTRDYVGADKAFIRHLS